MIYRYINLTHLHNFLELFCLSLPVVLAIWLHLDYINLTIWLQESARYSSVSSLTYYNFEHRMDLSLTPGPAVEEDDIPLYFIPEFRELSAAETR